MPKEEAEEGYFGTLDDPGTFRRISGPGNGRALDPLGRGLDLGGKAHRRVGREFSATADGRGDAHGLWLFSPRIALAVGCRLRIWQVLGVSGFLGFFVSDLCLFKAFLVIGPRRSLLVTSLTPPLAVLISWAWHGRGLGPQAWLAMAVTLAGVLWVVLEQPDGEEHPHGRRQLRYGLFLAFVATVTQSVGTVLAKDGIADYDPAASALIRILGALIGYVLLITLLGRWRPMVAASRQRRPMLILSAAPWSGRLSAYRRTCWPCRIVTWAS